MSFPDLPGCISDGETIEEAIKNGFDAMNSWVETSKEFNDPVPEPSSSQASGALSSGYQKVYMPDSLHALNKRA